MTSLQYNIVNFLLTLKNHHILFTTIHYVSLSPSPPFNHPSLGTWYFSGLFLPSTYHLSKNKRNLSVWMSLTFHLSLSGLWSIVKNIHASKQSCLQVVQYLKDKREPANLKCSKTHQGRKGDTCLLKFWAMWVCGNTLV